MTERSNAGRLAGKVALITGGAGNIGEMITYRYLQEGATVVISGRNQERLEEYRRRLIDELQLAPERVHALRMDGSDMAQVRAGVAELLATLGRIDILVNNAGSAGPRRRLSEVPLSVDELQPPDAETLPQALGNLLGNSWNLTRAVAPHMPAGGSVINVSTIFSRTTYYGRTAYVVPKAALNALSQGLAYELGTLGIRVNTIYPGPIESERIRTVFDDLDGLQGRPEGSTAEEVTSRMRLSRPDAEGVPQKRFPSPLDVANTALFLGSDESAAFNGQAFEVTHGMDVPPESRSSFVSRPGLRNVDALGKLVLVLAGDQFADALELTETLRSCRATVALAFRDRQTLRRAEQHFEELNRSDAPTAPTLGEVSSDAPLLLYLNPLESESVDAALEQLQALGGLHHAIILPAHAATGVDSLVSIDDQRVQRFLDEELIGSIAIASRLDRFWGTQASEVLPAPRVLFVSNGDDGQGNRLAEIQRAAIEQLVRIWRHERNVPVEPGESQNGVLGGLWANQIIRYTNREPGNAAFAFSWVIKLLASDRRVEEINLYLPAEIVSTTGAQRPSFGWAESLFGLHLGKSVLITGGSAGIGGQLGRLLALSGANVMLAARGEDQLEQMRASIVRELREAGYPQSESRVQIFPDCDVADEEQLAALVERTVATFGRIDYLINNAGISGAEEMVIDMPPNAWRRTLRANLVSNYSLIRKIAPLMKQNGNGYIINVSSYFGGEKYVAIPYPNRSDYAVSKAGQRALAEVLPRFLGPEIQINAIAPGPVDGDRLRGTGERPGLFARRGRLILENKRLNELYAALIQAQREEGRPIVEMLPMLMQNDVRSLLEGNEVPNAIRSLARAIWEGSDAQSAARTALMNEIIAQKLLRRLEVGGYLDNRHQLQELPQAAVVNAAGNGLHPDTSASLPRVAEPALAHSFKLLSSPGGAFFSDAQIMREARRVNDGITSMLHLRRMPTEFDVALATVFYLVDRNVTGETFHPSGGLRFERTVTEGELFGKGSPQRLEKLRGSTVFLVGDFMHRHLITLARTYLDEHGAARVVLLTETGQSAEQLLAMLPEHRDAGRLCAVVTGSAIEAGIDHAIALYGRPGPVISTPFRPLPRRALATGAEGDWSTVLNEQEFDELCEQHLTHHFRVAQKISLMDGAHLVLVTPETSARSTDEEFALANFIKTSLHALTVTLGAESERVVPHVPVNQVDLTRRARSEEPRNAAEEEEELNRFVQAVLLVTAPLPTPKESRYRARIYRGNAITV